MPNDPSPEIYTAMDRAGLVAGHILSKRIPMEKVVTEIRVKLVNELKEIIERRENGRTEI